MKDRASEAKAESRRASKAEKAAAEARAEAERAQRQPRARLEPQQRDVRMRVLEGAQAPRMRVDGRDVIDACGSGIDKSAYYREIPCLESTVGLGNGGNTYASARSRHSSLTRSPLAGMQTRTSSAH